MTNETTTRSQRDGAIMTSTIGKFDLTALKMRGFGIGLCLVGLGFAEPVSASLGGTYSTVGSDRLHMNASLQSTVGLRFTTHVLRMANSTLVREFAGSDGVVFAVAWRGPPRGCSCAWPACH